MRRSLVPLALAVAAGCASPASPAQVTGSVSYRERIALPAGGRLRVTLLDVSLIDQPARVVAERELEARGQVPIPFALEVERARIDPDRRYALHAELSAAEGGLRWATPTAVPVLTRGAPSAVEIVVARVAGAGAPAGVRVFAYDCAGLAFRAEVGAERAIVFLAGRSVTLPRVPSASGAKFSDGSTTFWSRGAEASLHVDGALHTGCRQRARPVP